MKDLVVHEVVHQGLEPLRLLADLLEVVESGEYDLVTSGD